MFSVSSTEFLSQEKKYSSTSTRIIIMFKLLINVFSVPVMCANCNSNPRLCTYEASALSMNHSPRQHQNTTMPLCNNLKKHMLQLTLINISVYKFTNICTINIQVKFHQIQKHIYRQRTTFTYFTNAGRTFCYFPGISSHLPPDI